MSNSKEALCCCRLHGSGCASCELVQGHCSRRTADGRSLCAFCTQAVLCALFRQSDLQFAFPADALIPIVKEINELKTPRSSFLPPNTIAAEWAEHERSIEVLRDVCKARACDRIVEASPTLASSKAMLKYVFLRRCSAEEWSIHSIDAMFEDHIHAILRLPPPWTSTDSRRFCVWPLSARGGILLVARRHPSSVAPPLSRTFHPQSQCADV